LKFIHNVLTKVQRPSSVLAIMSFIYINMVPSYAPVYFNYQRWHHCPMDTSFHSPQIMIIPIQIFTATQKC